MSITETTTKIAGISRRGNRYVVRYRDPEGRNKREPFRTLEEAKRFQLDIKMSIQTGHFLDPRERKVTVRQWAEQWSASKVWRKRTRGRNESSLNCHILPTFGDRYLGSIRQIEIQTWVNGLTAKGQAPGTVGQHYGTLVGLYKSAVANGKLAKSPCVEITLPESDRSVTPDKLLSVAQVIAIANAMPAQYRLTVWLGAMAGLRIGEALGATEAAFNVGGRTYSVFQQWTADGAFGPPKTKSSRRIVPIPDELLSEVATHQASHTPAGNGLLFTAQRNNGPVNHRAFHAAWTKAVADLGLPEAANTFHALRHHYASTLIEAGENPKVIQKRLGHANIAETMDTYGHLFEEADDRTRDAFAGRYATTLRAVS